MKLSDWISLGSLMIAMVAVLYTYLSNTKKYELASQYRQEILTWYSNTVELLIRLKIEIQQEKKNFDIIKELIPKLSSQIEIGRLYFPNIINEDNFGSEKPSAYRGRRNLILDFLVYYYDIVELQNEEPKKYIDHMEYLQRQVTSYIFDILNPRKFLKDTHKYTNRSFSKETSFEDFIKTNPDEFDNFFY